MTSIRRMRLENWSIVCAMGERIFVTGIDTDIGKTVISAILVEALEADYWKPVQAGDLEFSDTAKVRSLTSNQESCFFEESFRLNTPASPHHSALLDGVEIHLDKIIPPTTPKHLVIEGAGGLMVPLNEKGDMILDVLKKTATKVVLVSKNYLGSINHTLSAFEVLKSHGLKVDLIVFNGDQNESTERIIVSSVRPGSVLRVPSFQSVNKNSVYSFCKSHKNQLISEFI
jgi:dethiobiotin synthetase